MADILREVMGQFLKRYRDMLDGSHAEVVAIGGPGVAIGDVNMQVGNADVGAANPVPISYSGNLSMLVPNGTQADQRLMVDATAGGVQFAAFHADTTQVYWSFEDAQCRVTFDNSAPTATNGHIVNPGDSGVWAKALATAAKFIRTGATSATIHASQMK